MTKKNTVAKGLLWIIPALFFLCNPNIAVIDFLPDFIGYILLCIGLSRIADLNEELLEARTVFLRMILIDAGKLLAILWIFGMESARERSSSFLLWAFVFGFLEIILLVPAYQKLFGGILSLGNFYENTVVFQKPRHAKKGKSITERMRSFSVFFVLAKAILSFLPELADLTNLSYDEQGIVLNLYRYIGTMRALCFLPMLVIGVIWLFRMIGYVRRLRSDRTLMDALENAYVEKVLPNTGMFIGRSVTMGFVALLLGAVLTLDIRIDSFNVIPDVLAFLGFLFFFLFLKKRTSLKTGLWTVAVALFGILCAASSVAEIAFFDRYSYGSLIRNDAALSFFIVWMGVEVGKALSFLLLGFAIFCSLHAVVHAHTGYVMSRHLDTEVIARHVESVQKELKRYTYYMLIATVLYAASDVAYVMLASKYGFMGLINTVCALIWIATVWKAQSEIAAAVKVKYILE